MTEKLFAEFDCIFTYDLENAEQLEDMGIKVSPTKDVDKITIDLCNISAFNPADDTDHSTIRTVDGVAFEVIIPYADLSAIMKRNFTFVKITKI